MEEKVLVKGKFSKKNILMIIFLIATAISFIVGIVQLEEYNAYSGFNIYGRGESYPLFFVLAFVFGIAALISYLIMSRCEIVVTDKRVYGKIKFGVRVDLPLKQISSVGQSIFQSLSIATSSGVIKFWLLENRAEVFNEISNLLSKFQENNNAPTVIQNTVSQSNADELKKYKDLLDSGVITQEEFEAKKKQILGL